MKSKLPSLGVESPAEAWRAIETIVCGQAGRRDLQYLARLALPEVEASYELSDEEKPVILKASLLRPYHVFAQKIAYNVGFSKYGDILEINYEPCEACVVHRTLQYRANKWRLFEVMYGCE